MEERKTNRSTSIRECDFDKFMYKKINIFMYNKIRNSRVRIRCNTHPIKCDSVVELDFALFEKLHDLVSGCKICQSVVNSNNVIEESRNIVGCNIDINHFEKVNGSFLLCLHTLALYYGCVIVT